MHTHSVQIYTYIYRYHRNNNQKRMRKRNLNVQSQRGMMANCTMTFFNPRKGDRERERERGVSSSLHSTHIYLKAAKCERNARTEFAGIESPVTHNNSGQSNRIKKGKKKERKKGQFARSMASAWAGGRNSTAIIIIHRCI